MRHGTNPVRELYRKLSEDDKQIFQGNGNVELPAYAWPGGYTVVYQTANGYLLCAKCATASLDDSEDPPIDYATHDEGEPIPCEDCGVEIESSYGPVE